MTQQQKKILIVDDKSVNRYILSGIFENVWLAGNFLKGSLDGINVNFTGIR